MPALNVLHVIARLPVGGVENQLLQVIRTYDRSVVNPMVCSLTDRGEIGAEIEQHGVEVHCLHAMGHRFDWAVVRSLRDHMRKRDVAVVRTHQYHPNLYGRLAARLAGAPCVVASVHNLYTRDRKPHRRFINNILAGISDRIIAVSEAVKADIVRYDRISPGKIDVIRNGVDAALLGRGDGLKVRSELGIPADAPVVGTVGRLTGQKGHRFLVNAMPEILSRNPKAVLCIVGEGPEKNALREASERNGSSHRLVLTGSRRDIPDCLAMFDVFAFPSLWEGLPNAMVEAMAAGKAIVASDIPPVREVIREGKTGMIVPVRDEAALSGAINAVLANRAHAAALGNAARQEAAERFSISATVERYTALFEEILSRKKKA